MHFGSQELLQNILHLPENSNSNSNSKNRLPTFRPINIYILIDD